jgi:uncharacterized membrane protein
MTVIEELETTARASVKAPPVDKKAKSSNSGERLLFLDWTRGLAVVIMLQGHVFHSFSRNDLRTQSAYMLSQFLGGIGPAVFLVLTGITLAFLMDRSERRLLSPAQRWVAALRRSGYLFLLAFLFRIQLWIFGFPDSPAVGLLKVDILNCMGFAIALMSILAFFTTVERIRLGAGLGVAIAAAAPVVSQVNWGWLPGWISAYFVPNFDYFAFFPWAAFIAFGLSIGSLLRVAGTEQINRLMQWGAIFGFGLIMGGQYFADFPYSLYSKSDFWLNSPALIFIKLGVVMLFLAFAFLWTRQYAGAPAWSWIRQLGTTSLLVYWVHIELVYGRWFGAWKQNLNTGQVALAAMTTILLMLGLSVLQTRWRTLRLPSFAAPLAAAKLQRVSGD